MPHHFASLCMLYVFMQTFEGHAGLTGKLDIDGGGESIRGSHVGSVLVRVPLL